MGLPQRYDAAAAERHWQAFWARERIYEFAAADPRPTFAIDTPPPTVSGELHIGHVYSYVQAEAMARFWRMQGYNVFYPFGFDDNGLPTERYVETQRGIRAREAGRAAFIQACLEVTQETEARFEEFWKRLGMSADWRMRYSTIDPAARRISQWSFIHLYRQGLIYRARSPNPWCVECQTAIAQAEMDDIERAATFYALAFGIADQQPAVHDPSFIEIATTRPELLPACVAVFVHPEDARFASLIGRTAIIPLFGRRVPILADPAVDPHKGSGAVMCCTFGDAADVAWWQAHHLPLIPLVTRAGQLSDEGGPYAGLALQQARTQIVADLRAAGALIGLHETGQSVRVHERCGTPLEILDTAQWFVRILDAKEALIQAGRQITWHPAYMRTRYEHWVENLGWDWCISRQRFFGVPFPLWHCDRCGAVVLADESQLPVDPLTSAPPRACECGNTSLRPEEDVMDTWATSSLSPQIAARMLDDPPLYARLFPMQLRPQAHDIIRTWAFYTIVKSLYHFGAVPWEAVMIAGHGLDPTGRSIHKSKGNSPIAPDTLIGRYGADAVRYWACGGSVGADQPINEREMQQGARLITKLWSAARFIEVQLADGAWRRADADQHLLPTDRAMRSWLQRLIERATASYRSYEYAAARDAAERFFWGTLCDNYLEWVKGRLYDTTGAERRAAQHTLYQALLTILKLFAPVMPHITEEIYAHLFAPYEGARSIHLARWPEPDDTLLDAEAERHGEMLLAITTWVRRFKSAQQRGPGSPLAGLVIATGDAALRGALDQAAQDLRSVTRAASITFVAEAGAAFDAVAPGLWARIAEHDGRSA